MFVISNNETYNALYHFLTPHYIKSKLIEKKYTNVNIFRDFSGCSKLDTLINNGYTITNNNIILKTQSASYMLYQDAIKYYKETYNKLIGTAYYDNDDSLINTPKNYNYQLDFPLIEAHQMLQALVFKNVKSKKKSWHINDDNRNILLKYLGLFPSEMQNKYVTNDSIKIEENQFKYILFGDSLNQFNKSDIRTISKIGYSYGFVTETAYVIDFKNKIDFFITIGMYVNDDGISNDGKYENISIAKPFFAKFSQLVYKEILNNKLVIQKQDEQHFEKFEKLFKN